MINTRQRERRGYVYVYVIHNACFNLSMWIETQQNTIMEWSKTIQQFRCFSSPLSSTKRRNWKDEMELCAVAAWMAMCKGDATFKTSTSNSERRPENERYDETAQKSKKNTLVFVHRIAIPSSCCLPAILPFHHLSFGKGKAGWPLVALAPSEPQVHLGIKKWLQGTCLSVTTSYLHDISALLTL